MALFTQTSSQEYGTIFNMKFIKLVLTLMLCGSVSAETNGIITTAAGIFWGHTLRDSKKAKGLPPHLYKSGGRWEIAGCVPAWAVGCVQSIPIDG